MPFDPWSAIIKVIPVLGRPRLHIACPTGDIHVRHEYGFIYPPAPFTSFSGGHSVIDLPKVYPAVVLRIRVHNFGFVSGTECNVFVERVLLNGREMDHEQSPLAWMEEEGEARFRPRTIRPHEKRGCWVDVCKTEQRSCMLQLVSKRNAASNAQYHTYGEAGTYRILLAAEGSGSTSHGSAEMVVAFDPASIQALHVTSFTTKRQYFRWW
jgi:hypothetical protein